jgi:hypothetical protein
MQDLTLIGTRSSEASFWRPMLHENGPLHEGEIVGVG